MTTSLNNNNYTIDAKQRNNISDFSNCENEDCKQKQLSIMSSQLVDSIEQDKLRNHIIKIQPIDETSSTNENMKEEEEEASNAKNKARIECSIIHKNEEYSSDNHDEEDVEDENYEQDEREDNNYDKDTQSDDSIELDNNRHDHVVRKEKISSEIRLSQNENNKPQKCLNNRSQTNSQIRNSDSVCVNLEFSF